MRGLRRGPEAAVYLGVTGSKPAGSVCMLSVVKYVSATGGFLVQRSPTKFVSDIECVEV
jgi:hypothetical protein